MSKFLIIQKTSARLKKGTWSSRTMCFIIGRIFIDLFINFFFYPCFSYVMREFIESEREYVRRLQIAVDVSRILLYNYAAVQSI